MSEQTKDVYGELIGCDEMHYAKVNEDSATKYEAATPEYLAPAAEIQTNPTTNTSKRYYDNKVRYIDVTEGDTEVKIVVSGVPCSLAAKLTGKIYDATNGKFYDTGDLSAAPYCALSGRMSLGSGDEYRYFSYLKGKFALGGEVAKSKEDGITVNTTELTYTAAVTVHKFQVDTDKLSGAKAVKADTTDAKFTGASAWFSKVQTPPEPVSGQSTQSSKAVSK